MVLLDMQSPFPGEGKMLGLPPESARSSRNTATAWRDRGTRCSRRIFMRPAGMRHTAEFSSRFSSSLHLPARNSVVRRNVRVTSFNASFGLLLAAVTLQLLQER